MTTRKAPGTKTDHAQTTRWVDIDGRNLPESNSEAQVCPAIPYQEPNNCKEKRDNEALDFILANLSAPALREPMIDENCPVSVANTDGTAAYLQTVPCKSMGCRACRAKARRHYLQFHKEVLPDRVWVGRLDRSKREAFKKAASRAGAKRLSIPVSETEVVALTDAPVSGYTSGHELSSTLTMSRVFDFYPGGREFRIAASAAWSGVSEYIKKAAQLDARSNSGERLPRRRLHGDRERGIRQAVRRAGQDLPPGTTEGAIRAIRAKEAEFQRFDINKVLRSKDGYAIPGDVVQRREALDYLGFRHPEDPLLRPGAWLPPEREPFDPREHHPSHSDEESYDGLINRHAPRPVSTSIAPAEPIRFPTPWSPPEREPYVREGIEYTDYLDYHSQTLSGPAGEVSTGG